MKILGIFLYIFILLDKADNIKANDVNVDKTLLKPNVLQANLHLNKDNRHYIEVSSAELKPNQFYKIMVHYIGAFGVSMKIELICSEKASIDSDIESYITSSSVQSNILDDFNEFDFVTNNNGLPSICGDDTNRKDKFTLLLQPNIISYQLIKISERLSNFNFAVELVESKFNTDDKVVNILTNKNLYKIFPYMLILVAIMIVLRNKLKVLLFITFFNVEMNFKDKKSERKVQPSSTKNNLYKKEK